MINWIMEMTMRREALKIASWAEKTYRSVKKANPDDGDQEIFQKMFFSKYPPGSIPDNIKELIRRRCISIEGLCYTLGISLGPYQTAVVFRCSQFTKYMDQALYNRGFNPQPRETKISLFKDLNLLVDGYEQHL